ELLCVPAVYVDDLFVTATPEKETGRIHVHLGIRNMAAESRTGHVDITVASARSGETTAVVRRDQQIPAGLSLIEADVTIDAPHLWDLNDPYLYRVTARVAIEGANGFDEQSTRCGFRDFRFTNGYFRLNGRRIYLRSSHTCNHYPIGVQLPEDPDLLRRDLLNMKVMGFNAIRFIWGGATRAQLDLCDEIGLLVYNESHASMPLADSPRMAQRFDAAVSELVRRDRNHPSVVIWGLLNEARDGPVFQHAVGMLPMVRTLDPSRMVLINSGRWDEREGNGIGRVAGLRIWPSARPTEPWVAINATTRTIHALGITWPAGHLALHPGPLNEFSVVRWTAPAAGEVHVSAAFTGLAARATTDVHVLHDGHVLFDGLLNLGDAPNEVRFNKTVSVEQGGTLDFVVGSGNAQCGADTTGLSLTIKTDDTTHDATADFSADANPGGVWSYGRMTPAASPKASTFAVYPAGKPGVAVGRSGVMVGSLANPGSVVWEDVLKDMHLYPRVPHTAEVIQSLRTLDGNGQPVFLSEYGIGSAVDLWRAVRHFEQRGAEGLEDARFFREKLSRFEEDWKQWRLDETFARPEDFFMESLAKMAGQRTLGLNAIRSNPNIISHSLTGAVDHVMCGEGLTTLFRELKPGTIDALYDAWAPLRWCLFAEPVHLARGGKIRLEAVLANEDVLTPGEYPARFQVIGPGPTRILDRTVTVTIRKRANGQEPPLAEMCFAEDVVMDGPSGEYRFLATFERGAAAAGGKATFFVTDPADMPAVETEVVLWGDDPWLAGWLADHGLRTRPFSALAPAGDGRRGDGPEGNAAGTETVSPREVILVSSQPASPGGAAAFAELARRIAAG
ncbi:glycoside hydrolase family 2, partial [bacterium]|nr:glycoside hydrolase family 2 [bacterium]